jgi:site-specific recombinase XerD
LSPRTASTFLASVKSYFNYLREGATSIDEYTKFSMLYDKIKSIKPPKIPKTLYKKSLTISELDELIYETSGLLRSAVIVHFFLGSRPIELSYPFAEEEINLERKKGKELKRVIDFDNQLISIITAKTKSERIIPISDVVLPYFEDFFYNHDQVLNFYRPRYWLTSKLRRFGIGAKTARQTFVTLMTGKSEDTLIKYWVGHTFDVTSIYRDYLTLMDELKSEIVMKHFIHEII